MYMYKICTCIHMKMGVGTYSTALANVLQLSGQHLAKLPKIKLSLTDNPELHVEGAQAILNWLSLLRCAVPPWPARAIYRPCRPVPAAEHRVTCLWLPPVCIGNRQFQNMPAVAGCLVPVPSLCWAG